METLRGIVRVLLGLLATLSLLGLWMLFFIAMMGIALYVVRFFPLTGQWRKRFKARRLRKSSGR
jgi:hypothetical protein